MLGRGGRNPPGGGKKSGEHKKGGISRELERGVPSGLQSSNRGGGAGVRTQRYATAADNT